MLHVVLDELLDFRTLGGLGIDVDEDRTGQRLIGAIDHGFHRRRDRALAGCRNRHGCQFVLVLDVVGKTEVAQTADVTRDALHQHVVVFGRGEVATGGLGFAVDRLGEVFKRTGIRARAVELDRTIRPGRIDLLPGSDLALRGRFPDRLQFGGGHRLRPVVLRVDDDGQRVVGDGHLDVFDPGGLAVFHFLLGDRARGVGNIRFATAELLEAAAGTGNADRHADRILLRLLEIFGHRFGDRINGRGTINLDHRLRVAQTGNRQGGNAQRRSKCEICNFHRTFSLNWHNNQMQQFKFRERMLRCCYKFSDGMSLYGLAHRRGQLLGAGLDQRGVLAFNHDPEQRFGSRGAQQHAALAHQAVFDRLS